MITAFRFDFKNRQIFLVPSNESFRECTLEYIFIFEVGFVLNAQVWLRRLWRRGLTKALFATIHQQLLTTQQKNQPCTIESREEKSSSSNTLGKIAKNCDTSDWLCCCHRCCERDRILRGCRGLVVHGCESNEQENVWTT